jgi:hypothetical protein
MPEIKNIVVTKVGDTSSPVIKEVPKPKEGSAKRPSVDHHKTTLKKPLKSILKKSMKIKDVRDPAKSPPLKPGMHKHTLKMFTSKGHKKFKKTLKKKLSMMKKPELDRLAQQSNLKLNPNTPPEIAKKILSSAITAGFVSTP